MHHEVCCLSIVQCLFSCIIFILNGSRACLDKTSKQGLATSIVVKSDLIVNVVVPPVLVSAIPVTGSSNNGTSQSGRAGWVVMLADTPTTRWARGITMVGALGGIPANSNHEAEKVGKNLMAWSFWQQWKVQLPAATGTKNEVSLLLGEVPVAARVNPLLGSL